MKIYLLICFFLLFYSINSYTTKNSKQDLCELIEKKDVTHHVKNGWYMEVLFIIDVWYKAKKTILSEWKKPRANK
jgi:hypothetical protein